MDEKLKQFIIFPQNVVLSALTKIDDNKKRFLIVIGEDHSVLGSLTDGDIRRAFIQGMTVEDSIQNIYHKEYVALYEDDTLKKTLELFQGEGIEFLPIVDKNNRLKNILTKKQFQSLLLTDKFVNLRCDFINLPENDFEYNICAKEWGFYKTTLINQYFQSKLLCINPSEAISLQSHKHREEYWIVVHGKGKAQIGDDVVEVSHGSTFYIPKECKHQICNCSENENLIVAETQLGEYFGEDDIIRYRDIYGRV